MAFRARKAFGTFEKRASGPRSRSKKKKKKTRSVRKRAQLYKKLMFSFVIELFFYGQIWHNPLLKWNSSKFGGLESINVSPRKVWLPDIVLYEK